MERAYSVKAVALIFQDEWFSWRATLQALFTMKPDFFYSLRGELSIHLSMLRVRLEYQLHCRNPCFISVNTLPSTAVWCVRECIQEISLSRVNFSSDRKQETTEAPTAAHTSDIVSAKNIQ